MGGVVRVAQPCGCRQEIFMSQKRERLCEHRNLFEKPGSAEARRPRGALKPGRGFAASPAQRAKARGMPCVGCGREASPDGSLLVDPAHVWPRGKGGCDHPDCVLPLCRLAADGSGCHRLFDEGGLDLLERLAGSEAWAAEQAHPILCHGVGLVELVRRLAGSRQELVWVDRGSQADLRPPPSTTEAAPAVSESEL